jgi:hypothetical protein
MIEEEEVASLGLGGKGVMAVEDRIQGQNDTASTRQRLDAGHPLRVFTPVFETLQEETAVSSAASAPVLSGHSFSRSHAPPPGPPPGSGGSDAASKDPKEVQEEVSNSESTSPPTSSELETPQHEGGTPSGTSVTTPPPNSSTELDTTVERPPSPPSPPTSDTAPPMAAVVVGEEGQPSSTRASKRRKNNNRTPELKESAGDETTTIFAATAVVIDAAYEIFDSKPSSTEGEAAEYVPTINGCGVPTWIAHYSSLVTVVVFVLLVELPNRSLSSTANIPCIVSLFFNPTPVSCIILVQMPFYWMGIHGSHVQVKDGEVGGTHAFNHQCNHQLDFHWWSLFDFFHCLGDRHPVRGIFILLCKPFISLIKLCHFL